MPGADQESKTLSLMLNASLESGADSAHRFVGALRALALGMIALLIGCSLGPLPLSKSAAVRQLNIENPEHRSLQLQRVGGESMDLGSSPQVMMSLEADRYMLNAGDIRYPVPLLADITSADTSVTLTILPKADVPSGFVFVPGGPTLIGDVLGVGSVDERPARIEDIDSFFIAETETTNAQYTAFLNANQTCDLDWIDLGGPKCRITQDASGMYLTDATTLPVVTVSYFGAVAYCEWMSKSTGITHRLPTEVEWERMARGPSSTTYAYGDIYDPGAANQASGRLMPVKSFPAQGFGLFEVTGNAFEWTSTEFREGMRILKGGSYVLDGPFLRNSFRMWYRPMVLADDIGFRVLREIQR
jgi:formylglycine-generating enzyme required for sulfatase activity